MRSHARHDQQERETPTERRAPQTMRRFDEEACRKVDVARLLSGEARRIDLADTAGARVERIADGAPSDRYPERRPAEPRAEERGVSDLARLQAEASTMKREQPAQFSAVEREVERLKAVVKLEDPRQLKIEIQRNPSTAA